MPIVPEKLSSRQRSRSAISSQFWESPEHSARYIDGQVWQLPCEPPALNLTGTSGLSRTQQLIASQSLGIPAVPSYDANSGGLVLDRIIAKVGGRRWWTALGTRAKIQKLWTAASDSTVHNRSRVKALRDLSSYSISARSRIQLGKALTLNGVVDVPDPSLLHPIVDGNRRGQVIEQATACHLTLRAALPGHDVTASVGSNLDYVDSAGEYARVPLAMSLDLASQDRADGLQYKVGVHQVCATATEFEGSGPEKEGVKRTVLHAQGAVAVEGETSLWKPFAVKLLPPQEVEEKPSASPLSSGDQPESLEGVEKHSETSIDPRQPVQDEGQGSRVSKALASVTADGGIEAPAEDDFSLTPFVHSISDSDAIESEEPLDGPPASHNPQPATVPMTTATSISETIAESLSLIRQLKDTVTKVTSDVQDGSLQRLSQQLHRQPPPVRLPYSILLSQPHLKLQGSMGCLARMPLPAFVFGQDTSPRESGLNPVASSRHHRNPSMSSLASRNSVSSNLAEAWEPYLKGTALRVFASAGISGQVGRFTRPFLDYTSASCRLDIGLTTPHLVGALPSALAVNNAADTSTVHRPDRHRAFALEGRGSWHALSVSLAQQVIGPIRARADFRFALDPINIPQDARERSTLKGLAQTAFSVRPSLLEAVYGADAVLPGTGGAARVAMWWSPKRGEAMVELRMF